MNSVGYGKQLIVYRHGRAHVQGVDFETSRIKVLARNEQAIVLKVAGRSFLFVYVAPGSVSHMRTPRASIYPPSLTRVNAKA